MSEANEDLPSCFGEGLPECFGDNYDWARAGVEMCDWYEFSEDCASGIKPCEFCDYYSKCKSNGEEYP